ncbi:MAG: thioesterase family protein [Sneathiella sp.]
MSGYIESLRGHVLNSQCDLMGHMNVQFYNACISQAMGTMFGAVGVSPEDIKTKQRGFAAIEQTNRYHAELLAGDIIHVESGVLKSSSRTVTFHHKLYNSSTGKLSYEATLTAAFMDLGARKAVPLDEDLKANIATFSVSKEDQQ